MHILLDIQQRRQTGNEFTVVFGLVTEDTSIHLLHWQHNVYYYHKHETSLFFY